MTAEVLKSNALVVFVRSKLIQDVQILIDDRQAFNALPGKYERQGVKTLTTWPVYVTAVLKADAQDEGGQS